MNVFIRPVESHLTLAVCTVQTANGG